MPATPPFVSDFSPYFMGRKVAPGTNRALMQQIHYLRFQVYCRECNYLPAADYPDGLEGDPHDAASQHFCALDLREELAGYVRLVPADAQGRFPFQAHCPDLFDSVTLPPPRQSGEISRLMVQVQYRRRRGDTLAGTTLTDDHPAAPQQERRNDSPQILLAMFRQMYASSVTGDIRYWYAAMERPLARALKQLGFDFLPIGPATDYYGPVAPYLADLRELETKVGQVNPELLRWMREPLA
jgi:N-acyl amino acid synthase of PEP-CTERM/exosortase system